MSATQQYLKPISDYFGKLMYAALADLDTERSDAGVELKEDPYSIQTYRNLCKPVADRAAGVKGRFTFAIDVKQYLAELMHKYITEMQSITINPTDRIADVCERIPCDEYISSHIIRISYGEYPGILLRDVVDEKKYIDTKVSGVLTKKYPGASYTAILNEIALRFDSFMRVMARYLCVSVQYTGRNLSGGLFMTVLIQNGMPVVHIEDLRSIAPPKKTRPATKKPAAAAATPDAVVPDTTTPDAAILDTTTPDTAEPPAEAAGDDDADIAALLGSM